MAFRSALAAANDLDAVSIPVTVPRTIEEPAYRAFLGALSGAATAHGIPAPPSA